MGSMNCAFLTYVTNENSLSIPRRIFACSFVYEDTHAPFVFFRIMSAELTPTRTSRHRYHALRILELYFALRNGRPQGADPL